MWANFLGNEIGSNLVRYRLNRYLQWKNKGVPSTTFIRNCFDIRYCVFDSLTSSDSLVTSVKKKITLVFRCD